MLKNEMTDADRSAAAAILNDGTVSSSHSSKSYSEIIGATNIGQAGDATSWANFKYALQLLQKGNNVYRAGENLPALTVSSVMMAMGEINAKYQLTLGSIAHSSAFLSLENLSYNAYSSGGYYTYPDPVFGERDPYDGWYTSEKRVYEYILQNFRVFVYPRNLSNPINPDLLNNPNILYLKDAPLFDISSTAIRHSQGRL